MEDIFHLGIKALLRNDEGEILLLQVNPKTMQGKDYWDLPGGRVQQGQNVLETLEREVEEETGITDLRNPQEIGMVLANIRIPLPDDQSAGLILNIYTCDMPAGAAITLSDEHTAQCWVSPAEAAERLRVKYPAKFCDLVAQL